MAPSTILSIYSLRVPSIARARAIAGPTRAAHTCSLILPKRRNSIRPQSAMQIRSAVAWAVAAVPTAASGDEMMASHAESGCVGVVNVAPRV